MLAKLFLAPPPSLGRELLPLLPSTLVYALVAVGFTVTYNGECGVSGASILPSVISSSMTQFSTEEGNDFNEASFTYPDQFSTAGVSAADNTTARLVVIVNTTKSVIEVTERNPETAYTASEAIQANLQTNEQLVTSINVQTDLSIITELDNNPEMTDLFNAETRDISELNTATKVGLMQANFQTIEVIVTYTNGQVDTTIPVGLDTEPVTTDSFVEVTRINSEPNMASEIFQVNSRYTKETSTLINLKSDAAILTELDANKLTTQLTSEFTQVNLEEANSFSVVFQAYSQNAVDDVGTFINFVTHAAVYTEPVATNSEKEVTQVSAESANMASEVVSANVVNVGEQATAASFQTDTVIVAGYDTVPVLTASMEQVTQIYSEVATQVQLQNTGETATAVNFQTVADVNQVYTQVATEAQLQNTGDTATAANLQTVAEVNQVYSMAETQDRLQNTGETATALNFQTAAEVNQIYTEVATQAQLQNTGETATAVNFQTVAEVNQVYTDVATQAQLKNTREIATAVNFQTAADVNQVYTEVATQAQLQNTGETATTVNFETVAEVNQVYSEVATQAPLQNTGETATAVNFQTVAEVNQVYTEVATQAQLQNTGETASTINFISDAAIATFLEINSKTINSLSEVTLLNSVYAFDVSNAEVITASSKKTNGEATFANLATITNAVQEEISTNFDVTNGIPNSIQTETTPTVTAPTVSQASYSVTTASLHSSVSSTTSRSTAKTNPAVKTTMLASTTVPVVIQTSPRTANGASTIMPVNVLSSSILSLCILKLIVDTKRQSS